MNTFDDIYVLDLHGSSKKKERAPDGSKDENVFDIQQGVAIGIFVKRANGKKKPATVRHAEVWGSREAKYRRLFDSDIASTCWKELTDIDRDSCLGSFHFFAAIAFDFIDEYCEGWSVKDIFGVLQNAVKTDRDDLFYAFEKEALENRFKIFYSERGMAESFRERYRIEDSSSYALLSRRLSTSYDKSNLHRSLYRPYDVRHLYYLPGLTSRPAWDVMQHMLAGSNLALITTRQTSDSWDCLATDIICGHKSCAAYDINSLFPLYIYSDSNKTNLFDSPSVGARRPNLSLEFIKSCAEGLKMTFASDGHGDLVETFGPEDVFDYMYAVFHAPT